MPSPLADLILLDTLGKRAGHGYAIGGYCLDCRRLFADTHGAAAVSWLWRAQPEICRSGVRRERLQCRLELKGWTFEDVLPLPKKQSLHSAASVNARASVNVELHRSPSLGATIIEGSKCVVAPFSVQSNNAWRRS
jgi:hypothetical protein